MVKKLCLLFALGVMSFHPLTASDPKSPRAREAGIVVGTLPPGPLNAITDVAGVRIGQTNQSGGTEGDTVHTGVTAIFPHGKNVFEERVPAAIFVGNGFGKLIGTTQVQELGELETPILLTGTLGVWKAADTMVGWLLSQPGMEKVRSINPVVGETNDGVLNDIRSRPLREETVIAALESAAEGPVLEGTVGAGTGTVAFGWKGGMGTSSRKLPKLSKSADSYTVGVLVQTNFGGDLTISGVPVGRALEQQQGNSGDGSIMIIVATDAPLSSRSLERLASRAMVGLARTGSNMANGSGDYVIAFSTALESRRRPGQQPLSLTELPHTALTPLFQAVAEATEEAIYNSMFKATGVKGQRATVTPLPLDPTLKILKEAGVLKTRAE